MTNGGVRTRLARPCRAVGDALKGLAKDLTALALLDSGPTRAVSAEAQSLLTRCHFETLF